MGAYCDSTDMIALFGWHEMLELSNLADHEAQDIDAAKVEAAIAYAEAEVNSYLGKFYNLAAVANLATVPVVLTNKTADIARYQLDNLRARDDVRQRYEDALKWLAMVAKGLVDLGLPTNEPTAQGGAPDYFASDRVFTQDTLKDY